MDTHAILSPGATQIAYTLEGPAGAPVILFSNSLGTRMAMWEEQARALSHRFRVLRYDTRGHGASGSHDAAACTLPDLGSDVLRLLDALGIRRVNVCGISMGGLTGLWLAIHAPERVQGLIVANSAPKIGTAAGWRERAAQVRTGGMGPIADGASGRWFTPAFCDRSPQAVHALINELRACPPAGYAACCEALADADVSDALPGIEAPTLVIAGRHDAVTTSADALRMAAAIPGARHAELDASHLSNIEAAAEFNRQLRLFLE